jgi:hypothetical protein
LKRYLPEPFKVSAGAMHFLGSFMIWHSGDAHYVNSTFGPAFEDNSVALELKSRFPNRKLSFGTQN